MTNTTFPVLDYRFRRGNLSALKKTAILNGSLNFTQDTREFFVDIEDKRIKISDLVLSTEPQIVSMTEPENKLYLAVDTFKLMYFDRKSLSWKVVGSNDVTHSSDADFALCDGEGNIISKHYISINESNLKDVELQHQIDEILHIIGDIERFDIELIENISELPLIGTKGIIYFVRENNDELSNDRTSKYYGEYIWIEDSSIINGTEISGYYEKIGITTVDLTNYYTKQEIDTLLSEINDKIGRLHDDLNLRIDVTSNKLSSDIAQTNIDLKSTKENLENIIAALEISLKKYTDDSFNVVDFGDEDEE